MVILGLILFISSGQSYPLEPIKDRPRLKTGAGFYEQHIAVLTPHSFFVWHRDGSLRATLQARENERFTAWTLTDVGLLISYSTDDDHMASRLYDKHSLQPLHEIEYFSTRFQTIQDRLYAFPVTSTAPHVPPGYPYLFDPIVLMPSPTGYDVRTLEPAIAKAHPAMIQHHLAYKDAWLVPHQQGYLVMNTLEAKIYHYTPFTMSMEQREGIRIPPQVTGQPIDLSRFKPLPHRLDTPSGVFPAGTIQQLFWNYDEGHSRILGFYPFRKGYLVAYTIPNCPQQDNCRESWLGLQWLNRDYYPVSSVKVVSGMMVGIRNDSVYLLQFERPLEMKLPAPPYRPYLVFMRDW